MPVSHGQDAFGRELTHVPLSNRSEHAILWREDYEAIVAEHGAVSWFAAESTKGYFSVRFWNPVRGRNESVARLVMSAPEGRRVRARNDNSFDLRRCNLVVGKPKGHPETVVFVRPGTARAAMAGRPIQ